MTPPDGESVPVLLPQVGSYLTYKLPHILATMRDKQLRYPDEVTYWKTVDLRCRRPKGMSREELSFCLELHLARALDAEGFAGVYVGNIMGTTHYTLRWHAASLPQSQGDQDV